MTSPQPNLPLGLRPDHPEPAHPSRKTLIWETLVSVCLIAVGAAMAYGAVGIPSEAGYGGVGANFLPWVVSIALMVCGAILLWHARTGGYREMEEVEGEESPDWINFVWVSAGLLLNAGCGLPVEPAIRVAALHAAHLFEAQGAVVTALAPFMTQELLAGLDHFWRMRSLVDLDALPAERRASVLPVIRDWADSARAMSGADVFRAYSATHAVRVATQAALQPFDYVISPVSPNAPAPFDWPSPTNDPLRGLEHIGFTVPFNMGEQPAISVNCGTMDSPSTPGAVLPIGLQIAGQRFDDLGVLQMARAFEQLRGPQRDWPQPPMTR